MKNLLTLLLAVIALFAPPSARAQNVSPQIYTLSNSSTNYVAALTTNTYTTAFPYYTLQNRFASVAVTANFIGGTSTNTGGFATYFDTSLDTVNWSLNTFAMTNAITSTNAQTTVANFDTYGIPFIRLGKQASTGGLGVTNITTTISTKQGI